MIPFRCREMERFPWRPKSSMERLTRKVESLLTCVTVETWVELRAEVGGRVAGVHEMPVDRRDPPGVQHYLHLLK
jgi:hypothetical protein